MWVGVWQWHRVFGVQDSGRCPCADQPDRCIQPGLLPDPGRVHHLRVYGFGLPRGGTVPESNASQGVSNYGALWQATRCFQDQYQGSKDGLGASGRVGLTGARRVSSRSDTCLACHPFHFFICEISERYSQKNVAQVQKAGCNSPAGCVSLSLDQGQGGL